MRGLVVFLFAVVSSVGWTQRAYTDSLLGCLKKPVYIDTMRAFQYNELAWMYLDISIDSSFYFSEKGLNYSLKIGYLNGELDALNTHGIIYRYQSNYSKAIEIYERLIAIATKKNRPFKLSGYYSNLGSVYYEQAKFGKALAHYQKAYSIAKKLGQIDQQLVLINNLGVGYKQVGLFDQALHWFQIGLKQAKEKKDGIQEGTLYGNIATVYFERGMHQESMEYSELALAKLKEKGMLARSPNLYYNLVNDYRYLKKLDQAERTIAAYYRFAKRMNDAKVWSDYFLTLSKFQLDKRLFKESEFSIDKAISFVKKEENPSQYGVLLTTKAQLFQAQKNFDKALDLTKEAEQAIELTEDSASLILVYGLYKDLYTSKKEYKQALYYSDLFSALKNRVASVSVSNQIATLNALNALEQKEKDLRISHENNKRIQSESERKSNLISAMIIGGLLVILLLALVFRSNMQRKKANAELSSKNTEINSQKRLIEEKQNEIVSSIHYAKRIQETLLASEVSIQKHFHESFIFFKPKDIVSGDFYWGFETDDSFYLAVCDSTGHGVPGAFMSALNSSFLNEAISQLKLKEPGEILDHVRNRLVSSISHDGAKDGMDGVLFCYNWIQGKMTYAASYNAPLIVRQGELLKGEADRMPIGLSDHMRPFSTFTLEISPGDRLYAFTDGITDQFGGEQGKKLKLKRFMDFIRTNKKTNLKDEGEQLAAFFNRWKGDFEQIDDVCVIALEWKGN